MAKKQYSTQLEPDLIQEIAHTSRVTGFSRAEVVAECLRMGLSALVELAVSERKRRLTATRRLLCLPVEDESEKEAA